jgi:hypothetical protein
MLGALALAAGCQGGAMSVEVTGGQDGAGPGGGSGGGDPGGRVVETAATPARLLTRYEFDNAVSELVGFRVRVSDTFPSENLVDGFENNAYTHRASPLYVRQLIEATEAISERAMAEARGNVVSCGGVEDGSDMCARVSIDRLVRKAFRRPGTTGEISAFYNAFKRAEGRDGFDVAMRLTLQAIMQSPQFLYRLELHDGEEAPEQGRVERVGPYEMASRLSFFLWASPPDDALLAAAAAGELETDAQLRAQVARMLEDDRARAMVREFFRQWLRLDRLETLVRDQTVYPAYRPDLNGELRISFDAFIDHVVWSEGTFEAFYTSPTVFVTPTMAEMVGDAFDEASGGVMETTAPEGQRAGVLTQPALMAMLAYPNQPSPIQRGVFVREQLLCQDLPDPPDDADLTPPDPRPGATSRELFAELTKEEGCANCHALINPLGFGFEHYDALGRWRELDEGNPVDASGALVSSPDPEINGPFDGAIELAERFSTSPVAIRCAADRWMTFALGRQLVDADDQSFATVMNGWERSGWRWEGLFEAIVLSDAFRHQRVMPMELDEGGAR